MRLARAFPLFLTMLLGLAAPALSQGIYPTKPVKIVVGFAAGGLNDVLARLIAVRLGPVLGQSVVVENRPGAASNIAHEFVARAEPDGHTLLLSSMALAINPSLSQKLSYDPLKDLAPIIQISSTDMLLMVNPNLKIDSLKDLVDAAKARPGALNYGSAGIGSPIHLASEVFKYSTGIDIMHVAYKGSSEAMMATISGEVQVLVDVMPTAVAIIKQGKLKPLAVASRKRAKALPNVPTSAEAGFGNFEVSSWNGVLAPTGTPKSVIDRLNEEIAKIMNSPEIQQRVFELGAEARSSTPAEFGDFIRREIVRWTQTIKAAGIKAE